MTPFVKIRTAGRDITEFVEGISYEDTVKKDSMLEINVIPVRALELLEDINIAEGATLYLQFGLLGVSTSPTITLQIQDVEGTYAGKLTLLLRCLDMGHSLKTVTSNKIWTGKTSSQIAEEIAKIHGLKTKIEPTIKIWQNQPQGNKSDFDFLQQLAISEGDFHYHVYVRNGTLFFEHKGDDKSSIGKYTYGNDERFISFRAKYRSSTKDAEDMEVSTANMTPNGSVNATVVNDLTKNANNVMGEFSVVYGNNRDQIYKGITDVATGKASVDDVLSNMQDSTSKKILVKTFDQYEAENGKISNNLTKEGADKILTGTLIIQGDPHKEPNTVITLEGVAKRHSGNWYIEKVTHDLKRNSGFTTTLELNKNAAGEGKVEAVGFKSALSDAMEGQPQMYVYYGNERNFIRRGYDPVPNSTDSLPAEMKYADTTTTK